MGQVPHYAIVGAGRMARHFAHYLDLSGVAYQHWSRQHTTSLAQTIKNCTHIILLISDAAIASFIEENPCLQDKILIHFSGQLVLDKVYSAHPLMTFSHELYDLPRYQKILFVTEKQQVCFTDLFPDLPNPYMAIAAEQKSLYHALCVLSGNFTVILWQKVFREFSEQFGIAKEQVLPYAQQIFHNLASSNNALTGPLARDDQQTITANLQALTDDPFQQVYQAFVAAYEKSKEKS